MPDVLEEMTGNALVRGEVEARVDDWERRIDALYAQIRTWLPSGWAAASDRNTRMHEAPMREVGLPARNLPILDLMHLGKRGATIEPRGLWIVGANGRLDFKHSARHYVIVDVAENFELPQWRLASLIDRRSQTPLDRNSFQAIF